MKNLIHENGKKMEFIKNNEGMLLLYIGKKGGYYLEKFKDENNKFSWPAFFLGPLWFGYRKMYLESFIVGLIPIILFIIYFTATFFPQTSAIPYDKLEQMIIKTSQNLDIQIILKIVFPAILGIFANYLYFNSIEKRIIERKNTIGTSFVGVLNGALLGFLLPVLLGSLIFTMVVQLK